MQSVSVGTVLRETRVAQGIPLDVAARDTRIRAEVLEGLEGGRFDRLAGQVHIRGTLRTYARYLGLPEETLLERFRDAGVEAEEPSPPPLAAIMPVLRRRQARIVAVTALAVLALALGSGVLRVGGDTPAAADLATDAVPSIAPIRGALLLAITARVPVQVGIRIDGGAETTYDLIAGESRSFEADGMLEVRLARGGTADVVVNDVSLGTPGSPGAPWERTFRPGDKVLNPPASPSASAP